VSEAAINASVKRGVQEKISVQVPEHLLERVSLGDEALADLIGITLLGMGASNRCLTVWRAVRVDPSVVPAWNR
jgi:hypothetical protein